MNKFSNFNFKIHRRIYSLATAFYFWEDSRTLCYSYSNTNHGVSTLPCITLKCVVMIPFAVSALCTSVSVTQW